MGSNTCFVVGSISRAIRAALLSDHHPIPNQSSGDTWDWTAIIEIMIIARLAVGFAQHIEMSKLDKPYFIVVRTENTNVATSILSLEGREVVIYIYPKSIQGRGQIREVPPTLLRMQQREKRRREMQ